MALKVTNPARAGLVSLYRTGIYAPPAGLEPATGLLTRWSASMIVDTIGPLYMSCRKLRVDGRGPFRAPTYGLSLVALTLQCQ